MHKPNYQEVNAKAIDNWVSGGWEWGVPIANETFLEAKNGNWRVLLTPQKAVPYEWFAIGPVSSQTNGQGRLEGVKLLGLASGGGQQMPIFAALGADCTVLDYSERQLESERKVSEREGYAIHIVKADMTQRLPFDDESFELIFHPVSNCYVEDVCHVWRECYRVLKKGGILLAGMDNGINYLFEEDDPLRVVNKLPYNPLKDDALYARSMETDGSIQFSHTMEEQIGGQLRAGFILTDLYEDSDPSGLGEYVPQYIATRAIKPRGYIGTGE